VGSPNHTFDQNGRNSIAGAGAVFVYDRETLTSPWIQRQKMVSRGQERDPNTNTGRAIAGFGEWLAVGNKGHYDPAGDFYVANAGSVDLWKVNGTSFSFIQTISAEDGNTNPHRQLNDEFG